MPRKMKDSGIEWIGEIPEGWEVKPLKMLSTIKGRIGFKGYTADDIVDSDEKGCAIVLGGTNIMKEGYISYDKITYISEFKYLESPEIMLEGGEILITKVGAGTGENAMYEYRQNRVTINPNVMICVPHNSESSKYINYYLLSHIAKTDMYLESNKSGAQPAINQNYVKNIRIIVPPIHQQQSIANFLDPKCSAINKSIELLSSSIEKLQEYKKSVITEAVTKGLNPNVPMKDSGVEWIGDIPEEWKAIKIKYLCSMQSGENLTSEEINDSGEYLVYGGNGYRGYYASYNVNGDVLLVGRQGALCGNVHKIYGKLWATEHAVITKNYTNCDINYLFYLLTSMDLNQYSTSAAQPGLAVSAIQKLSACIPPKLPEQQAIAFYLDKKCSAIDKTIAEKQGLIEKLIEYKKSLIYEAVTGKMEII